jgi:hypothetical protein
MYKLNNESVPETLKNNIIAGCVFFVIHEHIKYIGTISSTMFYDENKCWRFFPEMMNRYENNSWIKELKFNVDLLSIKLDTTRFEKSDNVIHVIPDDSINLIIYTDCFSIEEALTGSMLNQLQ